jgi:serine/threonine protein kinase
MVSTLRWSDLDFGERLGAGQAGEVWLGRVNSAKDGLLHGEKVAIKRYKQWVIEQPGQYVRIHRELAASLKVRHPNVVENICLVTDPNNNLPALVMKYYEGRPLESMISRSSRSQLDVGDAFRVLGGVIDGVCALHDAGVLHRDVKPANILIAETSGLPIVMDLGVVSDCFFAEQTQTGDFLGTIRYADPNYLTGGPFTKASDWYSVGLVAYELFFGTRFLDSEDQWARLVIQKASNRLPVSAQFAKQCEKLAGLSGQDAAEAVFYALDTLLFKATPQNLRRLRGAISIGFWRGPFFEQNDGEIIQGEPLMVPSFRVHTRSIRGGWLKPHMEQETLKEAAERFNDAIALSTEWEEAASGLRDMINSNYWNWRIEGKGGIHDLQAGPLDTYPVYAGESGDDVVYDDIEITAGTLALHRYGYIVLGR